MPLPNNDPEFLYQALEGFYDYCTLRAAFANRIFDHLARPGTAQEVADRLGKSLPIVRKLLDCLVAMGLVSRWDDVYSNTALAELYCLEKSPLCQRDLFEQTHDTFAQVFLNQAPSLCPPMDGEGGYDQTDVDRNNRAGIAFAFPDTVNKVADLIESLDVFKTAERFLDLGAGHGLFAMEMARRKPDLEVVAFDLPPVVEDMRRIARDYGMEDRLTFMGGNMLEGEVQGAYDLIFASDCICLARACLKEFLAGLRQRLNPGGALILRNNEIPVEPLAFRTNFLLDLGAALGGYGDYMFHVDELPEILDKAGFERVVSVPLPHVTHYYVIHVAYR